jgi:SAM-dependent methyltransferase
MIHFVSPSSLQPLWREGDFLVSASGERFPVVNGIPRFVPAHNYADAFGYQWKHFARTQLDSHSGTDITRIRLERCLGVPLSRLRGKDVLEVGSGAGRFTELLLESGAEVHSVDLSNAVEVNRENMGPDKVYQLAQASVYELPFPTKSFDYVICLGVIQHTPSSERTIAALYAMAKPGGWLVIDHYPWRINYYFNPATWYRVFLKRMRPTASKRIVDKMVDFFFPLHWRFRNSPVLTWLLKRVSPLITFMNVFPELSRQQQEEWARLDTYDSLTDYYKHLRTPEQINKTLEELGGEDRWVQRGGNGVEARCRVR